MVEVKLTGVDDVLASLKALPPEIVSKRGGPVKTALRKAAQVIRKQAIANLDSVTQDVSVDGELYSTGLLKQNVVVTRGKHIIYSSYFNFYLSHCLHRYRTLVLSAALALGLAIRL